MNDMNKTLEQIAPDTWSAARLALIEALSPQESAPSADSPDEPGSGEVRMFSDTGAAKGSKPARFDMLPAQELWELAVQYGRGAEKYEKVNGLDNYLNGYDWSLSFAALQRHAWAFWNGEDIDPETGSKHIIAAAWHCLTLAHYMNRPELKRFDDRASVIIRERQETAA